MKTAKFGTCHDSTAVMCINICSNIMMTKSGIRAKSAINHFHDTTTDLKIHQVPILLTHWPHRSGCNFKKDRRWNADKPSAALDPYIPIWLTTSPAYQRPANFWKSFFFSSIERKLWKVLHFQVELVRTNLKLPFLDSSHTNNHLYIIYQSIMEMLTYFHRMSLNKNCGCMILCCLSI